ncbi:MAG: glycosyl hydrolase [Planctomycetota bacterium]|nr:MAG: glycosyl hydrolase [Planctomycetota bacterium]
MQSLLLAALFLLPSWPQAATGDQEKDPSEAGTFAGLKFRSIGPALASGRVSDFAVHPDNPAHFYAAMASSGVWKTVNAGTTWTPVFDRQGSYSTGCVEMDPNNPHVIWVGTGENNSQRSVSFGDGVYKSLDGGKTWKNVGLKDSEHIGKILIDPFDSSTVFVAAQGPLWRSGGDRGLYQSTDGGENWRRILHISDDTGVNEVHMDPRDPNVLYASAYQRRRHVWTLLNGGPESGIYKSTDGGRHWRELKSGLPKGDMGRIGMAISPANPDVIYAIVEATGKEGGFFRSNDRGETWTKQSSYMTSSPQYYNEIVCDPLKVDRVYSLNTFLNVTEDGGKTFQRVPGKDRHVDDHALWINPNNTDHLLVGCDGGVYDSYDRGRNWAYKANLPISQFYRVSTDNSKPFYYVYGGTQDNNTLGGPSRTTSRAGIANEDWFVTVGGDGYETQVDPEDPNIVYSLWQYGGLVRYDRRSGEIVDIKPREAPGDPAIRWNWDSPLLISPHSNTRLYFAGNILFRSDDRGQSWKAVSGDLSRGLDRNQLRVMGRIWSVDAVSKNRSTSFYGNCVALTESPLLEDLLYVGTDDGLIHVSPDGGQNWTTYDTFPGVPDRSYVTRLEASRHDPNTVFAAFHNHKMGDFKPYLLKSTDRGASWTSIAGDLPGRDIVWCLAEDHVRADLLFVGTEFGVYFNLNGSEKWTRLKNGLPTIAVRDIEIQRRENDLVLGTFGRSFYVLDDYSPLRLADAKGMGQEAMLFPVKDAWQYVPNSRLGGRSGRGSQGAAYFTAANPPFGAAITYHLKEKLESRKEKRQRLEKKAQKEGKDNWYPDWEDLRKEDQEQEPQIFITIRDDQGEVVRRISGPRGKGTHRVYWNLRYPSSNPIRLQKEGDLPPWQFRADGPMALPGDYAVSLSKVVDGQETTLAEGIKFQVMPLGLATLQAKDQKEAFAFHGKVARLHRAIQGGARAVGEAQQRLNFCRKAIQETPGAPLYLRAEVERLQAELTALVTEMQGDSTIRSRQEPTPPGFAARISNVVGSQWRTTQGPTQTDRDAYRYAAAAFTEWLPKLRTLVEEDLKGLETRLEQAGAPWTPGRIPDWKRN